MVFDTPDDGLAAEAARPEEVLVVAPDHQADFEFVGTEVTLGFARADKLDLVVHGDGDVGEVGGWGD